MTALVKPTRRGLLFGLASLLAAPAIVRAESLMPVKLWRPMLYYVKHEIVPMYGPQGFPINVAYGAMSWSTDKQHWRKGPITLSDGDIVTLVNEYRGMATVEAYKAWTAPNGGTFEDVNIEW